MSELTRLALAVARNVAVFAAVGVAIGYVCRRRHPLMLLLATVVSSLAVVAFLEWTRGELRWWWESPIEKLVYYILPYMWFCLLPTWFAAQWISRRSASHPPNI